MLKQDLERVRSQIKMAVQSHQILVARMQQDPQNLTLQKQLHDLQQQIKNFSERQKTIVTQLRQDLLANPQTQQSSQPAQSAMQPTNLSTKTSSSTTTATTTTNHNNNEVTPSPKPTTAYSLLMSESALICVPPKTSQVSIAPKPAATAAATTATATTATSSQSTTNVAQLPLKVPQFHVNRPSILSGARQQGLRSSTASAGSSSPSASPAPPPSLSNSISSVKLMSVLTDRNKDLSPEERQKHEFLGALDLITPEMLKDLQSRRSERKRRSTANPQYAYGNCELEPRRRPGNYLLNVAPSKPKRGPIPNASISQKAAAVPVSTPCPSTSQPVKLATATASISSAAQQQQQQQQPPPQPRKRGRPPKRRRGAAASVSSSASSTVTTESAPAEKIARMEEEQARPEATTTPTPSCSSVSSSSSSVNPSSISPHPSVTDEGDERSKSPEEKASSSSVNDENDVDVHEDYCAVCRRSGELLMCDTCSLVYHLNCCQPTLTAVPNGIWSCQKCTGGDNSQIWKGNLAMVHSYIQQKSRKDDEIKRQQLRKQEIENDRNQLKSKATQLQKAIKQQLVQHNELTASHQQAQNSVNQMKGLITMFQTSSSSANVSSN